MLSVKTKRVQILYFFGIISCFVLCSALQAQNRNNATIPRSVIVYNLPPGRNGLAETSFSVSGRVTLERWEKSTTVQVFIDWSEGTASTLNPAFKFDYIYQGVHYGNQHLGKDPFYDIAVERGSVKFNTVIMYKGQTINKESNFVMGEIVGNGPVDMNASDVTVFIKQITYVGFKGTSRIEKQINEILASTKKKENYSRLIREADQNMAQKNWASAISKYESAAGLFPDESYPQTQLNKINELKKADAAKAQQASAGYTKNGSGSSSSSNSKTNTPAGTQSSANGNKATGYTNSNAGLANSPNSPQFVRDNAGRYYEKDASNVYREISSSQYQQGRNALLKQKQEQAQAAVDAKNAQIIKDALAKTQTYEDGLFKNMNPDPLREAEKWANLQQSYYAAQAVTGAKNSLNNNSRLSGNFNSIQEIEAEFNQKYKSINRDVENLKTARNDKLQSDYNTIFYGSDAKSQAVGQLAAGLGTLFNEAAAAREARKIKEELEAQKRAEIAKIEERQKKARIEIRNKLFSQFPDGGLPLSSHNIISSEVYFFSYVFDKNEIDKLNPVLYLTSVFPVAQYSDGTWPFKSSVLDDISKLAAVGPVTIMGYYTKREMTADMRNAFKSLSEKSGIIVKEITYKGKAASSSGTEKTDFWGNEIKGVKTGVENQESNRGFDFWGNPIKTSPKDIKGKSSPQSTTPKKVKNNL